MNKYRFETIVTRTLIGKVIDRVEDIISAADLKTALRLLHVRLMAEYAEKEWFHIDFQVINYTCWLAEPISL